MCCWPWAGLLQAAGQLIYTISIFTHHTECNWPETSRCPRPSHLHARWVAASPYFTHPTPRIRVTTYEPDYRDFGIAYTRIIPNHVDVIVDSGVQSCLWSRKEFLRHGFSISDLVPVRHAWRLLTQLRSIMTGHISPIVWTNQWGSSFGKPAGMTYISPDAKSFFLSREAVVQLGIIAQPSPPLACNSIASDTSNDSPVSPYGCLKRKLPPGRPEKLPFLCISTSVMRMKNWLLARYAPSSFNKCPHQVLPAMEGPPLQIHVDQNAKPIAFRTPAPVPLAMARQSG